MAKAIIKINAFLDKKQTDEVYNSIYNQLKAGLDVIIVPAYCDVYVLDGTDVEVQKEEKKTHSFEEDNIIYNVWKLKKYMEESKTKKEKVENTSNSNEKICKNCEFYRNYYGRGQCYGQKDAPYVDDNENCDDFKFKKSCANCKHMNNLIPAEPCFSCIHGLCDENPNRIERWEAKDNG